MRLLPSSWRRSIQSFVNVVCRSVRQTAAVGILAALPSATQAQTWTGAGGNDLWSTPGNWNTTTPVTGGSVFLNNAGANPGASASGFLYDLVGVNLQSVTLTSPGPFNNHYVITQSGGGVLGFQSSASFTNLNSFSGDDRVIVPVTLNGPATFTHTGGSIWRFQSPISGTGPLTIISNGTATSSIDLQAVNTYSGATIIGAGARNVFARVDGAIPNTSALTVDAGGAGALFFVTQPSYTIGSLAGGGNVSVGGTLITGGDNSNTTFSGVIANVGSGALTKTGTGIMTLTGANTYTGATNVNGGTLVVNGSIVSAVTVNGGTLGGSGSVGGVTIGGTIAPGNSIGTLTVNGAFTQNANSRYQVELNSAGQSDLIQVNGAATINGGIIDVLAASGSYTTGQRWTILNATGGVTGRYSSIQDNSLLVDFRDVYTANTVQLEATVATTSGGSITTSAGVVPLTFNQASFLNYLSSVSGSGNRDLNFIISQLATLSNSDALHALDQMSGVQHANLLTLGRLRSLFQHGLLANEIMAGYGGFSPYSFNSRAQAPAEDADDLFGGMRTWGRFYGLEGAVNGDANSAGFNYQFTGFQIGADCEAWEGGRFGITGGYNASIIDSERVYGHAAAQGLLAGVYASQTIDRAYVFGAATYGYNNYGATRGMSFAGVNRLAQSDPEQNEFNALVEAGYNLNVGPAIVKPLVGLHYLYLNQSAFTESGASSLNLSVREQDTQALWGSLGLRAGLPLQGENWTFTPNVHARWLNDWAGEDRFVAGSLSGAGGSYLVQGASAGRNYLVTGVGVSIDRGSSLRLVGDYTYQTSGKQASHTGSGAVEVRW